MHRSQLKTRARLGPNRSAEMPAGDRRRLDIGSPEPRLRLELVVPVLNEEQALADSIHELHGELESLLGRDFRLTIADNGSTDGTARIGRDLEAQIDEIRFVRLDERGRGRALKTVWSASEANVVGYTNVDLSTDLAALPALLDPLFAGTADIAIGSRLSTGASLTRCPKREFISRAYNVILRFGLSSSIRGAQCGFKAARTSAISDILPVVEDSGWFFDTELLVLAERAGRTIPHIRQVLSGRRVEDRTRHWTGPSNCEIHRACPPRRDQRLQSAGSERRGLQGDAAPPVRARSHCDPCQ